MGNSSDRNLEMLGDSIHKVSGGRQKFRCELEYMYTVYVYESKMISDYQRHYCNNKRTGKNM